MAASSSCRTVPGPAHWRRRAWTTAAALAGILTVVTAPLATPPADAAGLGATVHNPLRDGTADPSIRVWNGTYFLTSTTVDSISIVASPTLAGLAVAPPAFTWHPPRPGPLCCDLWAPTLERIGGKWYVYFAAGDGSRDRWGWPARQRIFVLESNGDHPTATGYHLANGGRPVVDPGPGGQAIDPAVLQFAGRTYLLWSQYRDTGPTHSLFIARMSGPTALVGDRVRIATPTMPWERRQGRVIEAPAVLTRGGAVFVAYSANGCDSDHYATGLLTNRTGRLLDPTAWRKAPAPVLASLPADANGESGTYAPGGAEFFTSPDGRETWIAYHANGRPGQGCGAHRSLRVQRVGWTADTPVIGPALSPDTVVPVPSGEPPLDPTRPRTGRYVVAHRRGVLETAFCRADTSATVRVYAPYRPNDPCHLWYLVELGGDAYAIHHALSGKALGIAGCSSASGAAVNSGFFDPADPCQRWRVQPVFEGGFIRLFRVTNARTGLALDAPSCADQPYPSAQQRRFVFSDCQLWWLIPAG